MRRGARLVGSAKATRGDDRRMGAEAMDRAILHAPWGLPSLEAPKRRIWDYHRYIPKIRDIYVDGRERMTMTSEVHFTSCIYFSASVFAEFIELKSGTFWFNGLVAHGTRVSKPMPSLAHRVAYNHSLSTPTNLSAARVQKYAILLTLLGVY